MMVGREGIEPPQSKTADLQSAELTTCSTYPGCDRVRRGFPLGSSRRRAPVTGTRSHIQLLSFGAADGTRTRNRRFTKPLLYQLSYGGATVKDTALRSRVPASLLTRPNLPARGHAAPPES